MKVYKINENLYYGGEVDLPDNTKGIPLGTTRTQVPEIPEGKYAKWIGNTWYITEVPPL
jgi:hypothetical protein